MPMDWRRRFRELVLAGLVSNASLIAFRIAFGTVMFFESLSYLRGDAIEQAFLRPAFLFKFPGFEWVHPWPGSGLYLHFYLLCALALMVAAGFLYRLSAALFFLGFTYVFLL